MSTNKKDTIIGVLVIIVLAVGVALMLSRGPVVEITVTPGAYEVFAESKINNKERVVLFFNDYASENALALQASLEAGAKTIPENTLILDVNYDTETALKEKYGVTVPDTLVQVDKDGNLMKRWSGTLLLSDLLQLIM